MKLRFDQNLSYRLVRLLEDIFPESLHVRTLGLEEAEDLVIWNYAINVDCVIVTQDSDYSDWNKLRGAPPRIAWLRCGNTGVDEIHEKLRSAATQILAMQTEVDIEVVEIW